MSGLKSACLTAVFLTAVSIPASAQDGPAEPFSRAYVSALAGIAFTADRTPMLAIEYGERVHDFVQAYANLTYFNDVMTSRTRGHLSAAAAALAASTGTAWSFQGRDQGVAFTVGAKAVLARGPVRPYVGGGAGALNLRRKVVDSARGDVTDSFMDVFGSNDGNIGSASASTTKPLAEAVAGINVVTGRTYIDIAYRYRRAFHTVERIDFSQFGVGVGIRF